MWCLKLDLIMSIRGMDVSHARLRKGEQEEDDEHERDDGGDGNAKRLPSAAASRDDAAPSRCHLAG